MKKRIISILLVIAMVVSMVPVSVFAAENTIDTEEALAEALAAGDAYVTNTDELATAIIDGKQDIVLADGNYVMPTSFNGSGVSLQGKTLRLSGTRKAVIETSHVDERDQFVTGANLTFEGVTLNFGTANYMGFANVASLTYKDCAINGLQFCYGNGGIYTFENCDLNSNGAEHSVWTWSGDKTVSFTGCDFTYADRAVNCYGENGTTDISFTGCDFIKVDGAETSGAIETNSSALTALNLTINKCTVNEGDLWWVSEWDGKKGANTCTTVDGKVIATTSKQLAAAIAAAEPGDTITLMANVTCDSTIELDKAIIIDGKGYTLTSNAPEYVFITKANEGIQIENLNIVATSDATAFQVYGGSGAHTLINVSVSGAGCAINMAAANSRIDIYGGTFNCNTMLEYLENQDGAVYFHAGVVAEYETFVNAAFAPENLVIDGQGSYSTDVSDYLEVGFTVVEVDNVYQVVEKVVEKDPITEIPGTDIDIDHDHVVEDTKTETVESEDIKVPEGSNMTEEEVQEAAEKLTEAVSNITVDAEQIAVEQAAAITEDQIADAVEELQKFVDASIEDVTVETKISLEVKVKEAVLVPVDNSGSSAEGAPVSSLTVNITPMVTTTVTVPGTDAEHEVKSEPAKVTIPVWVTIPLPAGYFSEGQEVTIIHTTGSGKVYYHTETVQGTADAPYVQFKNENGFSEFKIVVSGTDEEITAILKSAYNALKTGAGLDTVAEDYPELATELAAVEELYDELKELVPETVMDDIFDTVVDAVVDNDVITEDVIAEVATDIAETLLTSDKIDAENKALILEAVAEALAGAGMGDVIGGTEIPSLPVIDDLREALSAAGYLTPAQEGEIVDAVAEVLFKYLNGEELSDEEMILVGEEVYNIVFNREDLSIQDKFAILTIIYNVLDKYGYVNNAYEMGYETVKGMGYVAEASKYIGIAIDAVETAKKAVSEFPVNEELATIKEALLAELEATTQTLTKIKGLLDSDALATKDGAWTELLNLRGELDNHIAKLQTLAAQIGFVAAPYIADAIEAYNYYSELIQKIAVEAYNNVVNAFETFADQYAILVEEIGKIADKCHPALGVAVRKYLTETPADALAILYAHGENAINVLLAKAALASGDIYNIAVALGQAFAENGEAIYNAVAESAEVDEILKLIDETKDELLALYEKAVKHPVTTAMKVDVRAAQTKILNLYNALFAEISQIATNVSGMEETAALVEALRTALIDLIDVADYAGQYGDWIAGDMMIMVDELLASLIANNDEFMQVFMPLFCENISFVNDYLTDLVKEYGGKAWAIYLEIRDVVIPEIINTIREFGEQAKEQILKQLNTVRDMVKNTVETVKEIIDELKLKLDELKTKVQNEAKAVVEKVEALLDYLKELLAKSGLSEDILKDIYDAIKQVEKALDALKEIINGNFESIYEMLDALAAAKAELLEALNNLADILKNDAKAVYDQIIKQLNTVNDAVNCLIDNRDEIVKELGLWLLAELVEALPTIDQKLYDFFYNNPDKVIAFFENYGDLIIENGEPVVAVLGYIAVTYGPEVLEWIIENPEEALELFVNWYEKYGYRVWPMIDVYLDALGVYDAAEEGFQAALEKLADLMDMAGEEITAELKAMIEDLQTALENLVAEVESVIAELTAKLEALEKELADLKAQLENAVGELKEQLEAAIAELEKKIAEIKAAIENLKAALKAIQEALLELNEAIETLLNEGFNAAIEAVQGALKNMTEAVEDLLGAISEETAAELKKAIESVLAKLNELYYNATHGEYTIYPFSHYVALGDGTAAGKSYVEMLAAELAAIREGDYDFTNLSEDGLMIQDVLEILAENAETVAGADLVTIGFGSNGFTNFTVEQLMKLINGETVEFDWAQYVGEDGVTYVETAKAELYARLVANGVTGVVDNVDVTELLMVAIESYAYGYVSYVCSLPEVVNEVHALNPEALVVVVGMYNPLADVVIDLEGQKLELGGYLQYLVDAANVDALAYAMLTGDVVYVDAPAVETNNKSTEMTLAAFMSEFLYYKAANLLPNENGHGYITEQILNALTITVKGLWGDVNGDGVVNHNDARLVLQYYVGAVTADDLDLTVADVDGNGVINHNDARLILQFYVEMIDIFPVEK